MPTSTNMKLPRPKDPKEFEKMCREVLQYKHREVEIKLYGRQGEKQYGIDLISSGSKPIIVAQCKNYSGKNIDNFEKQVKKDLDSAQKKHEFDVFYVMTTLETSSKIQDFIKSLEKTTLAEIRIMFWEDIEEVLCGNIEFMKTYYPQYALYSNKYIIPKQLNQLISNAINLKEAAEQLNDDYDPHEKNISWIMAVDVYKIAVQMECCMYDLAALHNKWNIQLSKMKIAQEIEWLWENRPEFLNEYEDGTGSFLYCTVSDFFDYFVKDKQKKFKPFIKHCDKIIKRVRRYVEKLDSQGEEIVFD